MKQLIFIFCALIVSVNLVAQDIIVTTNSKRIDAKILEVSKKTIKYKESDNLEGPTYVLDTEDINSIIYGNGKVVLYNEQGPEVSQKPVVKTEDLQQDEQKEIPNKQNVTPSENGMKATIFLRSGDTLSVDLLDMKSTHVSYLLDGNTQTTPADQINIVVLENGQTKTYTENIDNGRVYWDWQGWLDYINIYQPTDINKCTRLYLLPISYNSTHVRDEVVKSRAFLDMPQILKSQLQKDFGVNVVIVPESRSIQLKENEIKLCVRLEIVEIEQTIIRTMKVSGIVEGPGDKELFNFHHKHLSGNSKTIEHYLKEEFGIFAQDISNIFKGISKEYQGKK